jgi:hypothetical protein
MIDETEVDTELTEIRVTGMIPPLRDKLARQKKSLKRLLSKPKSERNTKMIKLLLREAKAVRKIIKKHYKQEIIVVCPHCGQSHSIVQQE